MAKTAPQEVKAGILRLQVWSLDLNRIEFAISADSPMFEEAPAPLKELLELLKAPDARPDFAEFMARFPEEKHLVRAVSFLCSQGHLEQGAKVDLDDELRSTIRGTVFFLNM